MVNMNESKIRSRRKTTYLFPITLIIFAVFCVCVKDNADASSAKADLDAKIVSLQTEIQTLTVDQENAFRFIKDETNLSKSVLLVGGILTVKSGAILDFPVSIVPGNFAPSAVQFDVPYPSTFTLLAINTGAAAVVVNKQAQGSIISGGERVIVFGLNQNIFPPGAITTLHLRAPTTTGVYQFNMANSVASDASGNGLITSTVSGTVVVN